MLNGSISLRSHGVPGGLYFGLPAWDAPVWPAPDIPSDSPPAVLPESAPALRALTLKLNFARYDIWTPSLPDQLAVQPLRHVILNLIAPQPESIMPRILSEFELPRLIAGLNLISQCIAAAKVSVVLPRHESELRYQWRMAVKKHRWGLRSLVNRYPLGHPSMLLRTLLGLKLKPDESPADHGVVLLDPISCWMLGCWIQTGVRPGSRPVELFTHNAMPRLIAAPLGQPLSQVLKNAGILWQDQQCIINGMMAGQRVDPAATVLEPWMQLISIRPVPAEEQAVDCIRCGWCVSACPSGLNPAALMAHIRVMDSLPAVSPHEASACIECGLCSYVCPSRLPLAVTIGGMKTSISAGGGRGGEA
jgi:electron transport complex protein RnfC